MRRGTLPPGNGFHECGPGAAEARTGDGGARPRAYDPDGPYARLQGRSRLRNPTVLHGFMAVGGITGQHGFEGFEIHYVTC